MIQTCAAQRPGFICQSVSRKLVKGYSPSNSVLVVYRFALSFLTNAKSNLATSPGLRPEPRVGGTTRTMFLVF